MASLALPVRTRRSSRPLVPPLISRVTATTSSRSHTGLILRFFQYSQAMVSESTGSAASSGSCSSGRPSTLPRSR
jgi:hypothetical protein